MLLRTCNGSISVKGESVGSFIGFRGSHIWVLSENLLIGFRVEDLGYWTHES